MYFPKLDSIIANAKVAKNVKRYVLFNVLK